MSNVRPAFPIEIAPLLHYDTFLSVLSGWYLICELQFVAQNVLS